MAALVKLWISPASVLLICLLCTLTVGVGAENTNNDGTVTFEGLPEGVEYHSNTGVISIGGFTLRTTWNIIDGFLKMISPAGPPYSLIIEALKDDFDTSKIQEAIPSLQGNFLGFIILFILGLVFAVFFALFLLLFCCCRLCGNCGGKRVQQNSSNFELKRYVYTILLLVTLFFMIFGAITALAVSGYTASQVSNLPETIDDNIEDMLTYINNTLDEINFLVGDQLSWTLSQIQTDVAAVGTLVGVPIREEMRPAIMTAINAVYPLDQYINDTVQSMIDVNTTQSSVDALHDLLDANLTAFRDELDNTCTACSCCDGFDYSGLTVNPLPPILPLDTLIDQMQGLGPAGGLRSAADAGAATFEAIPDIVTNTTSAAVGDLDAILADVQAAIQEAINSSTAEISSLDASVAEFKGDLDPILQLAVEYDQYRDTAMSVVFGFILFVAAVFVIGVCLGLAGHFMDRTTPANRSSLQNSGGCIIIIIAFISAALVIPFMMISSFTFIIGGPVDRLVCDNLLSGEIFTQTVDMPDTIVDGYFLGSTIFGDPTIDLTVSGLLSACEENAGIYTAFRLENLLNISQFTNIDPYLGDVSSAFENISVDFGDINSLLDGTIESLGNATNLSFNDTAWDLYKEQLSKNVTDDVNSPNDLSVLATSMRTAAASIAPPHNSAIQQLADDLDDIQTSFVVPFITSKDLLKTQIDAMTGYTARLDAEINKTVVAFVAAQDFLSDDASNLVQEHINEFKGRVLGYPEQFVTYTEDQIRNEVGRCGPVYNLYSSSVNTFCVGFIQAFNGFWYCLGLCCITMLFAFAFGVKSAKYYRRMTKDFGFEKDDNMSYPLTQSFGRVASSQHEEGTE